MMKVNGWKIEAVILMIFSATIAMQGQKFETLVRFDGTNGAYPAQELLAQGRDGNFYGTTLYGGNLTCERGCGTVFKITPQGTLTTLHSFCDYDTTCTDGANPAAGLTLGTDGNFYGTTSDLGGKDGIGTVFKITPSGILKTIYTFCAQPNCTDGAVPFSQLLLGRDNNFYGTTSRGGNGFGTVFKITPSGDLTTLAMFDDSNGGYPWGLTQSSSGVFYGTTQIGGENTYGEVFDMTESGSITVLYSFCSLSDCSDGQEPYAGLLYATDGALYGTTSSGGAGGLDGGGTLFRVSADGQLTTLYSFCIGPGCIDGFLPIGGLIQATDGNIYGTTDEGGQRGEGEIFRFSPPGIAPQILHSFCVDNLRCSDGAYPIGSLLQATNGVFYATTWGGGASNEEGTIFSLDMGLGPFVAFVRPFGKVGQAGGILGQGFTGTTGVSFNGVPAQFEVRADTFLTATVPQGATTGYVTVTTPTGVLTSNVPFRVIQ